MAETNTGPIAQEQAPTPQAAPQAPAPVTQAAPDPKLEAIIRREQKLYRQMRDIKAREDALKAKEAQWKPDEYVPKKRFQEDPLATLEELGLSYDKLTEARINQPNAMDPTIRALVNKINNLESKLNETSQSQQQAQTQQYEQVKTQMLADARDYTTGNPEFELVDKWGAHDMIVAEIEKEFDRTEREMGKGIIISMETAAKKVEDYLLSETVKALDFNKIKNYKKPVTPDSVASQTQQTQQNTQQRVSKGQIPYKVSSVKTLTNTMTQDAPRSAKDSLEDRKRRAIAAYNGQKVE